MPHRKFSKKHHKRSKVRSRDKVFLKEIKSRVLRRENPIKGHIRGGEINRLLQEDDGDESPQVASN